MSLAADSIGATKLAEVVNSLSQRAGSELAAQFARQLFDEVDTAEFDAYGTGDLVALANDAFESFRSRSAGQPTIVLRQRSAGKAEFLVADIVNDDMPFLLDSVLGELRNLGL